jgi:hypothetical protein
VITVLAHAGGDDTETLLEGLAVLAILVPYALAVTLGAHKHYERGSRKGRGPVKELERENARLKRIGADQVLENQAWKEISRETGEPGPSASGGRDAS